MFGYEVDEEITLKLIQESDARDLFALTDGSRAILSEWLPWLNTTKTEEDSLDFIKHSLINYEAKKGLNCGIFFNGELVGMAGFNTFDWTNRIGTIGYWLGEGAQGHGIMTRTVRGLIDYGFGDLELNRIEIRAAIGNLKSRAIPERLGFKEEGVIRQGEWLYNHYVDHAIYGLLKTEWDAN
ncbi:GNAT family N-acetyltransferase [Oceanobacillus sp. CAU 1775]